MEYGIEFLKQAFDALFTMADKIYTHYGVYPFIYGLFFVFVVVKFLLIPLFGGSIDAGSSDIAAGYKESRKQIQHDVKRLEMKD